MWGFFAGGRLSRLEERCEKLEQDLRTANLDFDELYQKCRKLLGRTVKERASIEAHTETPEGPRVLSQAGVTRGPLTERQRQIQQEILKRRAGG
jgi:hypothetical protein